MNHIKGVCLTDKVDEVLKSLENKAFVSRKGCYPELSYCEKNPVNCSIKVKNYVTESMFYPYDDHMINHD